MHKNRDDGKTAAAASLGLIHLWDIDQGLSEIDKYVESQDEHIAAGGYMALGIVNSGVKNEFDPVQAILLEKLLCSKRQTLKIGAILGLSFTYAGSAREDLLEALSPIVLDATLTIELQACAALAIGLIYVGTRDEDAA